MKQNVLLVVLGVCLLGVLSTHASNFSKNRKNSSDKEKEVEWSKSDTLVKRDRFFLFEVEGKPGYYDSDYGSQVVVFEVGLNAPLNPPAVKTIPIIRIKEAEGLILRTDGTYSHYSYLYGKPLKLEEGQYVIRKDSVLFEQQKVSLGSGDSKSEHKQILLLCEWGPCMDPAFMKTDLDAGFFSRNKTREHFLRQDFKNYDMLPWYKLISMEDGLEKIEDYTAVAKKQ